MLMWQVHEKIREDPMPEKKEREVPEEKQRWKAVKLTYEERKNKLKVLPFLNTPPCHWLAVTARHWDTLALVVADSVVLGLLACCHRSPLGCSGGC